MAEERGAHEHNHDHDHDLTFQPNIEDSEPGQYELMTYAIRELLIEKDHLTPEELRVAQEKVESLERSDGSKVIAKAWTDPDYKQRLLDDGNAALAELGIDAGAAKMTVVENTQEVQNVVVCTLCSCSLLTHLI